MTNANASTQHRSVTRRSSRRGRPRVRADRTGRHRRLRVDLGRQRAARVLRPRRGTRAFAGRRREAGFREPTSSGVLPSLIERAESARGALRAPASLIDAAWGFDKGSHPYIIDLYNQNYLLVARYTDHVNTGALPAALPGGREIGEPRQHRGEVPDQLQAAAVDDRGPAVGRLGRLHAAEPVAGLQRRHFAPVPRDELHAGALRELQARHRPRRRVQVEPAQRRLHPPVERPVRPPLAQLGSDRRRRSVRARRLRPAGQGLVSVQTTRRQPNIADYYGYGDLTGICERTATASPLMGRGNLDTGKGAARSPGLAPPPRTLRAASSRLRRLRRSLIDYNWYKTTIGAGVALNDAL